ncbi:hypothetical protein I551_0912 [Mycobacterium ulcerans str. Harvey]|uniref:Uncharacterized protein n=1 Tax=Mycobacterium ulcerans str. Harvey TaxID=1299332 RepID=A0ABP3ANA2_MYCUL|nr:hypothetical protein I551_0912 [Mycobacterium ulcerans str. Harvey]
MRGIRALRRNPGTCRTPMPSSTAHHSATHSSAAASALGSPCSSMRPRSLA